MPFQEKQMDYSKHPDVLTHRASAAEMQKWYAYMDEDFNTVYPDRSETVPSQTDRLTVATHVGQESLVAASVVQDVALR